MNFFIPFASIAAVGIVGHVIERKLERSGNAANVILIRIGSQVGYFFIALYTWKEFFKVAGQYLNVHVYW